MNPAIPLECVAFLLVRDGCVLAEKRALTKLLAPGAVAIPGGHVEPGETIAEALGREIDEELGIRLRDSVFICTLMHQAEELRRLHYFAATAWDGEIAAAEADAVLWVALDDLNLLAYEVDRTAVREYLRLSREGGLAWRTRE